MTDAAVCLGYIDPDRVPRQASSGSTRAAAEAGLASGSPSRSGIDARGGGRGRDLRRAARANRRRGAADHGRARSRPADLLAARLRRRRTRCSRPLLAREMGIREVIVPVAPGGVSPPGACSAPTSSTTTRAPISGISTTCRPRSSRPSSRRLLEARRRVSLATRAIGRAHAVARAPARASLPGAGALDHARRRRLARPGRDPRGLRRRARARYGTRERRPSRS